jgi:hypothetical protein
VNPAIQQGSRLIIFSTLGLWTGTIVGKADLNSLDRPKFREALIAKKTFGCYPCGVKCSLFWIRSNAFFHSSKSARFLVCSGYLSKCFWISCKSFTEETWYWIESEFLFL